MKNAYEKFEKIRNIDNGKITVGSLSWYEAQLDVADIFTDVVNSISDDILSNKIVGFNWTIVELKSADAHTPP